MFNFMDQTNFEFLGYADKIPLFRTF